MDMQERISKEQQVHSDRFLYIAPVTTGLTTQLEPYQTYVQVVIASAIGHTVKLPPVAEAFIGVPYVVRCDDAGSGCEVIAYGDGTLDDALAWADITLDTDNDFAVLMSDGTRWYSLVTEEA